ncbi:MAG: tetratricopeptide repeat protein [Saprospiraceae bacterium]|jgi:hypothetical protein
MYPELPENVADLLEKAIAYDRMGDVYNAVKLYKRVICLAPDTIVPYEQLVSVYKARCEWKSVLHYAKKAVSLDAGLQQVWWDMGIAASALGKGRISRAVWQKFGAKVRPGKLLALQLCQNGAFEVVWAQALDPTKAILCSIPNPVSGLRYHDLLLFDREIVGYCMQGRRKMPVFPVLWRVKQSFFHTFCCLLHNSGDASLSIFKRLCDDAEIGWEVWSDATLASSAVPASGKPEYFGKEIFKTTTGDTVCVALAAKGQEAALELLRNWTLISLGSYTDFRAF